MKKILIILICSSYGLMFFSSCNLIAPREKEEPVNRLKPEDLDEYNVADNKEEDVFFDEEDMEDLPEEVGESAREERREQPPKKETVREELGDEFTEKSGNTTAADELLVVTGSYSVKENAQTMVDQLKALGYEGAQIVIFREKEFHSVIAGTYRKLETAQQVLKDLKKEKGINAYIHKKRYGKD